MKSNEERGEDRKRVAGGRKRGSTPNLDAIPEEMEGERKELEYC